MGFDNYSKDENLKIGSSSEEQQVNDVDQEKVALSKYMTSVYTKMFYALLLTGFAAWFVSRSENLFSFFYSSYWLWAIAELGLVFAISAGIQKFESKTLNILFVIYSILNGITLSSIFLVYPLGTIQSAFFISSATFGICSFVGYKIKKDLSTIGRVALFLLIGALIATIVNLFVKSDGLTWILNYVIVGIFVILTAYDTQKLKRGGFHYLAEEDQQRWVIYGALELYLDFINLFIYILRILGSRRN